MDEIPSGKWPFQVVSDRSKRPTPWVVLHAPIQSEDRIELFCRYRRAGCRFVGMTSFMDFPANSRDDSLDYSAICEAWAHCFRWPEKYIPARNPHALVSLSDFTDSSVINPLRFYAEAGERFDFAYVGAEEPWKQRAKNWPLAKACIEKLSRDLGLRGVIAGGAPRDWTPPRGIAIKSWLPRERFLGVLSRCGFLLVPNVVDASPRVIAEALCLDVPVLMNEDILGGWKYITEMSGCFFSGEHDVLPCAEWVMSNRLQPRLVYMNSFGPRRAEQKLAALLQTLDPSIETKRPLHIETSAN